MSRGNDLDDLYGLLTELRTKLGGYRYLRDCNSRTGWAKWGVYFFFEQTEKRSNGQGLRVVRVGTHAVSRGSQTTLWHRLSQHKGTTGGSHPGGGNHRGSIFRLHVGTALLAKCSYPAEIRKTWGRGASASRGIRAAEHPLEKDVSNNIGNMPCLWLAVSGSPGPNNERSSIEKNCVALLSNWKRDPIDLPLRNWLGLHASHPAIRESGLWNVNYVEQEYDPSFLESLALHIQRMAF